MLLNVVRWSISVAGPMLRTQVLNAHLLPEWWHPPSIGSHIGGDEEDALSQTAAPNNNVSNTDRICALPTSACSHGGER